MPFPPYPDELEKATLAAVERSTKVELKLDDALTKLKTAFGKIDAAAFNLPEAVATGQELARIEQSLAAQKDKINTFLKSLTDCTKEIVAKAQQLKKEQAKPPAIKHVENMRSVASAFAELMAKLCPEAEQLVKKARDRLETPAADEKPRTEGAPGAPPADEFLPQGLKLVKNQPGLFALAIGSQGAYLVAGPRLVPEAVKQARDVTGGGSFLRGDCEWSQEKNAYVFGLTKKPPSSLAKKIRKAILDQTLNKLQVKVLVRGPDGQEIDADTDADTLGAVELEDATETAPPAPPPPPRQDSIVFAKRMQALSPVYDKAIKVNAGGQAELDDLSTQATTAAQKNNWETALTRLDALAVR